MQQAVQDGRGQHRVAEDLAPVQEALVRRQDNGGALVSPGNETKEQAGLLPVHGQVPDLVEHQDLGIGQLLQRQVQPLFLGGLLQLRHQLLQGQEQDPVTRLRGLHRQGDGQVGLAHPRRPQQQDVLRPAHEPQGGELPHHLGVNGRLEVEVELLQGLQPGQPGLLQPGLGAFLVPALPLAGQGIDQELPVSQVVLGGLFAYRVQLRTQVVHLQPVDQVFQFHHITPSYTDRSRRSTCRVRCHRLA